MRKGGAASGLSPSAWRGHSGGEGKGKRMPGAPQLCSRQCPRPAGRHFTRVCKICPASSKAKATNEWPDSVIESGSGLGYHRWLGGSKR